MIDGHGTLVDRAWNVAKVVCPVLLVASFVTGLWPLTVAAVAVSIPVMCRIYYHDLL